MLIPTKEEAAIVFLLVTTALLVWVIFCGSYAVKKCSRHCERRPRCEEEYFSSHWPVIEWKDDTSSKIAGVCEFTPISATRDEGDTPNPPNKDTRHTSRRARMWHARAHAIWSKS